MYMWYSRVCATSKIMFFYIPPVRANKASLPATLRPLAVENGCVFRSHRGERIALAVFGLFDSIDDTHQMNPKNQPDEQ